MGEGGGGEEKGRPDTKPFSNKSDRQEAIDIFHRCFDFMLPVCDTFMDRDAERNSKRL